MTQDNGPVCPYRLFRYIEMGSVIEYYAVHQHFHNGGSLMFGCLQHDFLVELQLRIQTACKEGASRAQDKLSGNKGLLYRSIRRSLCYKTVFGCR